MSFLHQLFLIEKNSCSSYHQQLALLYIKYKPALLLPFLESTSNYNEALILEQCKERKLYKEASYILEVHGRKEDVLTTLIDEMDAFKEAVSYVVRNHSDDHKSWKLLISKAKGDV
jgi:hypothetical protein